jgi:electron transport complex protein RnfA
MDAQTIRSLVAIFLAAILTENYVLNKFLGICPFLGLKPKAKVVTTAVVAIFTRLLPTSTVERVSV